MGSNQFDKIIKDKVQFHETSVDPGLWDKIEAALPVEKSSRRLPFFWLMSLCLILFSSLGFVGYHYLGVTDSKDLSSKINDTYAATTSDKNKVVTDKNIPDESGLSSSLQALSPESTSSAFRTDNDKVGTKTAGNPHVNSVHKRNPVKINEPLTENHLSEDVRENVLLITESVENNLNQTAVSANALTSFSHLPFYSRRLTSFKSRKYTVKDNCLSDFSSSPKNVFIEAYFGNDIPIRKLVARQPEFENLAAARRNSEKPIYSFSIGARLGFFISKDFQLLTGVNYSQINEKFDYVDPESSQTKIVQTTIYINDGMGNIKDSISTFDTIMIPGTLVYKIRNQYTTIDIPFLLGYKIWENEKINIVANVGVMANIMLKKEGMALLESSITATNFNSQDAGTFNHSLGLSTNLGLQFNYNLSHHLDLYIEPNVRFQHRGLTTKDYPIRHNYSTISFLTGVRYKF